jgi:hypothetical protein
MNRQPRPLEEDEVGRSSNEAAIQRRGKDPVHCKQIAQIPKAAQAVERLIIQDASISLGTIQASSAGFMPRRGPLLRHRNRLPTAAHA